MADLWEEAGTSPSGLEVLFKASVRIYQNSRSHVTNVMEVDRHK
jgi:hypothetical protein